MLHHGDYQQAIDRCQQRLEELRKIRDELLSGAAKNCFSTAKQIEWANDVIGLSEQHLDYLRARLAEWPACAQSQKRLGTDKPGTTKYNARFGASG